MKDKYCIITPAKNEEEYIIYTINSVIKQTILPAEWIIVDDGSQDKTAEIVKYYSAIHKWIKLVENNTGNEDRAGGPKVVRAFYKGFDEISDREYDFITKLDADITLPENYFEVVAAEFEKDPQLGICGGYIVNIDERGKRVIEKTAEFHVRGAFKSYRKRCFEQIGGIKPVVNWDGLDQIIAMYRKWLVRVLPLEVIHHRPTGTLINRGFRENILAGIEFYRDGGDLLLSLFKALVYGGRYYPKYLSAIAFFIGYLKAFIKKPEKHVTAEIEKYYRKFQYLRLQKRLNIFSRSYNDNHN